MESSLLIYTAPSSVGVQTPVCCLAFHEPGHYRAVVENVSTQPLNQHDKANQQGNCKPRWTHAASSVGQWTILHFNAQSIGNKFEFMTAEVVSSNPSVVCITETWLTAKSTFNLYQINGYTAYFNSRTLMEHGGVMILIKSSLTPKSLYLEFYAV